MEYDESYYVCCVMEHDSKLNTKSWNIAVSLDTYCLMWFPPPPPHHHSTTPPKENYLEEQSVPRGCGIAGGWHSPTLIFFQLETLEQFWCLEGSKISSNVTSPLAASIYLLTKKVLFIPRSESDGGYKKQFKCLNYNAKSQGNKTERATLLAYWVHNEQ